MDKPKRKKGIKWFQGHPSLTDLKKIGYNQCYDEYQASLPSEDQLGFIVFKSLNNYTEELARIEWTGKHYQSQSKTEATKVAKAISKRINNP